MSDEANTVELSKDAQSILDAVKKLSVLDLANLVKAMEEEFGVSAAAPVAVAGGGGDAGGGEAAAKDEFPFRTMTNYVNGVQAGNLIFLAGKGPKYADGQELRGKVGSDITIEEAYAGARQTAINQMAVLKVMLGDLNRVKRIVKVLGMVNCDPDFVDQPKVINGFSDLMVEVFGDKGKHARAAVGMASLPRGQSVEIELVVEVYDE